VSAAGTIIYRTPADGFGDHATDEDRDSFCAFVERRVEEIYPDYVCYARWGSYWESNVTVDNDDEDAPDEYELRLWIGNALWDEWCSRDEAAS